MCTYFNLITCILNIFSAVYLIKKILDFRKAEREAINIMIKYNRIMDDLVKHKAEILNSSIKQEK